MNDFRSKSGNSKHRSKLSVAELHRRWKKCLFDQFLVVDEHGEPTYLPNAPDRRYAPSKIENQAFKACQKFQARLEKICTKLYRSVEGRDLAGFDIPKNARKFQMTVAKDLGSWEATRSNVTKGRVRKIGTSIAERILAGFELHKDNDVGLELMRKYFEKDGEFSHRIRKSFGTDGEEVIRALCGKQDGEPLKEWVRYFRGRSFKNIVLPTDDPEKSNQERSRKGMPKDRKSITKEEQAAAQRTKEVERRIEGFVRSIRRK